MIPGMQIRITDTELSDISKWFDEFTENYYGHDETVNKNLGIKQDHTSRVCIEILSIGIQLGLSGEELRLAELIALLHDVGRFEQFARYRTFSDSKSENHALLGLKIIIENRILENLDTEVKEIVFKSIEYHNHASLPADESEHILFYSRLLRDADKLDIYKVVTDYYLGSDKNGSLIMDLPDKPGISEKVFEDIKSRNIVNIDHINNINDFKLLQAAWVFDINFRATMDRIRERKYLEKIRSVLPDTEETEELFEILGRQVSG